MIQGRRKWLLFGLVGIAIIITVIPLLLYKPDIESFKSLGYFGFFIANYFGWGMYMLPYLVTRLNPIALVLIGAFGSTIDEFVTWSLGKAAKQFEYKSPLHTRLEPLIIKYGVMFVFVIGIFPTPGIVTNTTAFLCGHYGIPFKKYFTAGLSARLISRTIWTYGFLLLSQKTILF